MYEIGKKGFPSQAETYDSGSKICPTFSDVNGTLDDPLANGQGFWIPCSEAPYLPNCKTILEDGWTFVRPDCHYPLYDHESLVAKLAAFEETVKPEMVSDRKKLGVMILGDSRSRGLFLEMASRVLDPETAANLTRSEYFKVSKMHRLIGFSFTSFYEEPLLCYCFIGLG